jgi:glucosamine--fructose-6-phosphate aminotransferase (isomerizing)
MCGIVGVIGKASCLATILDGLQKLEYRGYDSAGIAFLNNSGKTTCIKKKGNVSVLRKSVLGDDKEYYGTSAIAHTRWATHGKVTEDNAHPHQSGKISIVHNGIIENHEFLREDLKQKGYVFLSETDSEVIVHLLHYISQENPKFGMVDVIKESASQLEGAYGLVIMSEENRNELWVVRSGSPMIIGLGENGKEENFISSDELSLHPHTTQFVYLDEGEIACVRSEQVTFYSPKGDIIDKTVLYSSPQESSISQGEFNSFMEKEMDEQPAVMQSLIDRYFNEGEISLTSDISTIASIVASAPHIHIVACGTSYHSGLIAKDLFESKLGISTQVEVASEYRYRTVAVPVGTLFICISQSGETADTLAALRKANASNQYSCSIVLCNVKTSSMVREADHHFLLRAGAEIGVASTKAFTMQILAFLIITCSAQSIKGSPGVQSLCDAIISLPKFAKEVIGLSSLLSEAANILADVNSCIFIGRGQQTAIAMEGALKLKELSYIHAEAYAAGELKHGPLALIDEFMPVIVTAPFDYTHSKLSSNIEEVNARGGVFIIFADPRMEVHADSLIKINMPEVDIQIASIIYAIPLQLLSCLVAKIRGENVDQPRNLAKSVTVE